MTPTLHWFDTLPSTQDVAHELAGGGAPAGTAVVARSQDGGRGTRGRKWSSPPGGLWMSVILRPRAVDRIELLGIRIGLSLADALERASEGRLALQLKWPNDVIAADRKLSGILAEARWHGEALGWVVVGIGVNLTNEIPDDVMPRPIRTAEFGWGPPPELVAPVVVAAALEAANRIGPLDPDELDRFERRDWLKARRILRPFRGTVEGITQSGRLRLVPDHGPPVDIQDSAELALDR